MGALRIINNDGLQEFETEYNIGDVVIFKKNNILQVGIIEGYYIENNSFWFRIRISLTNVYAYWNGGEIAESDIICNLDDTTAIKCIDQINKI